VEEIDGVAPSISEKYLSGRRSNAAPRKMFHCHQQLHMDFGFMTLFDYSA
jgi:FtsP/CotA-like multicopper oxidase with cupredoxin domain